MNYETFTKKIKSSLEVQLGEEYRVELVTLPKNNRSDYVALVVFHISPVKIHISRSVGMDEIYGEYMEGKTLKECVKDLMEVFTKKEKEETYSNMVEELCDWERVKDRVYPMLLSGEGNESCLNRLLHRSFLNLEIVYYIVVKVNGEEGNVKVTNALSRKWELSEERIYSKAMENLENAGYELVGISTLLEDMTGLTMEEKKEDFMYVLLNENGSYGAAGILSRKVLQMCADKIQGNFYLLPSSIHEMIVVPDVNKITADGLRKMVTEINQTQVLPEERLCDAVFYYDLEMQEVQIAE